jgi:NADPH:quinone reductase-like Zn-dependent oxidoreductase
MKAMSRAHYGPPDVLRLQEIEKPAPAEDEVLIRVHAVSVNPLDSFVLRGWFSALPAISRLLEPKPKVIGSDIAGRVEALGSQTKQFRIGDDVMGCKNAGGLAEYVCIAEKNLGLKPANLSYEQAAAVPVAAITALQALRDHGEIQPGQSILIDGASGGVGTFAIQIAKSYGATVTAVCSTRHVETARSLGADHVIDYNKEDFAQSGQKYDLILGANAHHSILAYRRALKHHGIFVMVGGAMGRIFQALLFGPILSRLGSRKFRFFIAKMTTSDLTILKDLLETGKIAPVIDRTYPFTETVAAFQYREEGHARGKVVITIDT